MLAKWLSNGLIKAIKTIGQSWTSYYFYVFVATMLVLLISIYRQANDKHFDAVTPSAHYYHCRIQSVIDGDSVTAVCPALTNILLSVRLLDIDAPEIKQHPWGQQSRKALQTLLSQTPISIQFDGTDSYSRHLGRLRSAKTADVNLALVSQGMAVVYSRYQPPPAYLKAMEVAKEQHKGIWQSQGLQQNPQRYRRLMQY